MCGDENLWRTIQYSCMFYMLALHEFLRCLLELKHCSLQLCAGQFINPHFIVSFYSVIEEAWFDGWGPAGLFPAKSVASQSSVAAGGLNQENVQFKILLWIMSLMFPFCLFSELCLCFVQQDVGCDRQLGSNAKEDNCGVCAGDGSTCRLVRGQALPHVSPEERRYTHTWAHVCGLVFRLLLSLLEHPEQPATTTLDQPRAVTTIDTEGDCISGLTVLVNIKMMLNQIKVGGVYCSQAEREFQHNATVLMLKESGVRWKYQNIEYLTIVLWNFKWTTASTFFSNLALLV